MHTEITHIGRQSETCFLESYNSVIRYYFARLQRKTKLYSKLPQRLDLSTTLLIQSQTF